MDYVRRADIWVRARTGRRLEGRDFVGCQWIVVWAWLDERELYMWGTRSHGEQMRICSMKAIGCYWLYLRADEVSYLCIGISRCSVPVIEYFPPVHLITRTVHHALPTPYVHL